ncbi:MAG: fibronectin type III domain-containing protein [Lachnospiraceae bacterium]
MKNTHGFARHMLQNSILMLILIAVSCFFPSIPSRAEGDGQEAQNTQTDQVTVPQTTGLKVKANGTQITLTWDNMGSDYGYEVQTATNGVWNDYIYSTENSSYDFHYDFDMGNQYSFRIRTTYDYEELEEFQDEDGTYYTTSTWKTVQSKWSSSVKIVLSYDAPKLTSVKSSGAIQVTLKWNAVPGAYGGYAIYRSDSKDGTYKKIKTITDCDTLTCTDKKELTTGTRYYYKICTYNSDFKYKYGNFSSILSAVPTPTQLKPTAKTAGCTSVKISWKKEDGITGYRIYQASSKNGTYKKIKTITDSETTSFTQTGLTTGKAYYYKVRSWSTVNGKNYYSPDSTPVKAVPAVLAPNLKPIDLVSTSKVTLSWGKTANASGYAIYRSDSPDSTGTRVATVKSGSKTTCTISGLTKNKTYYFRVKAYRTVKGKNYYGSASSFRSIYTGNLASSKESYTDKCKRIYGTSTYKPYTSSKTSEANMTTITVKAWDIDASGKKYTHTIQLKVHKKIAPTVKQIFTEIYEGKEKFPIYSVCGYSWRGDNSTSEHCQGLAIDINPNENAMIDKKTGKILAGTLYEPGVNPYSIKPDGDVVKAFQRYGFSWGDWSTKTDYMHFSYFGT